MCAVMDISVKRGYISQDKLDEFVDLLKYFDLPTEVSGLDRENVYNQLFHDKKVSGNKLKFVIANKIGSTIEEPPMSKKRRL